MTHRNDDRKYNALGIMTAVALIMMMAAASYTVLSLTWDGIQFLVSAAGI